MPADPRDDAALAARLERRSLARLDRALRAWARISSTESTPGRAARAALSVASPLLLALDARGRRGLARRAEFRCWLAGVEDAIAIAALASRLAARRRPGRSAAWSRLVDLVADEGILARVAPEGRIPDRFPEVVFAHAAERLQRASWECHRIALAFVPSSARAGTEVSALRFQEDVDLGASGREAAYRGASWRLTRGRRGPRAVVFDLEPSGMRAGAEPLPYPEAASVHDGVPDVGSVLVTRGLDVRVGPSRPDFERRVARALALLDDAWPEGSGLVRGSIWRVVPVAEWATVSYSSPRRPGVAYVDVNSRPVIRLAEDLVHESIHIRLHAIEAVHVLLAAKARSEDAPRFYSPWRREWRPLRGLLHACCTFTAGAMFFERMWVAAETGALRASLSPARRLWLARRLIEETDMVARALPALRSALGRRLLTVSGERVVSAVAREHSRMRAAASRRRAALARTAAGRRELARAARLARRLERHPVRWSW